VIDDINLPEEELPDDDDPDIIAGMERLRILRHDEAAIDAEIPDLLTWQARRKR